MIRPTTMNVVGPRFAPSVGADGRPSRYFYWDDIPDRRLRPDLVDSATARRDAKSLARAEQDRLDRATESTESPTWVRRPGRALVSTGINRRGSDPGTHDQLAAASFCFDQHSKKAPAGAPLRPPTVGVFSRLGLLGALFPGIDSVVGPWFLSARNAISRAIALAQIPATPNSDLSAGAPPPHSLMRSFEKHSAPQMCPQRGHFEAQPHDCLG